MAPPGILNALDAASGKVLWSHNVATDTGRAIPFWGFASSPLIVDDVVVVAASATLAAYDKTSGELRWKGPVVRRQLQLAASRDDRRRRSDRVAGRTGRDQRRPRGRQGALDPRMGAGSDRPARRDRGRRPPAERDRRDRRHRHAPSARHARCRRLEHGRAVDHQWPEAVLQRFRRAQRSRVRFRRRHSLVDQPRRTASATGRADATATAR